MQRLVRYQGAILHDHHILLIQHNHNPDGRSYRLVPGGGIEPDESEGGYHMDRVVIIGNSGSGKTHLAKRLSEHFGSPLIHLDTLFWEPGGFNVKRPKALVLADVARLAQGQRWVVEGVFGELAQEFCPTAEHLIWLDLDWATCERSLLQRGSQSAQQQEPQEAEASFARLLAWAGAYWLRDDLRSQRGHQLIFERFAGGKTRLTSRAAVDDFVASVIHS
jgi:adenylate kinase family enzyme